MIKARGAAYILIALLCSTPIFAQDRSYTAVERELEYLMGIWPGNFDNREQVQSDADLGKPTYDSGAHLRVHGKVSRVDLPVFGEHVLYVEEYKDDKPSSVFRQRLYVLSADEEKRAVRIALHFFSDRQKWLGAHEAPAILDDLTPDDTSTNKTCDLLLKRDNDVLAGGMTAEECGFGEGDLRRHFEYQIRVGENGYAFRDHSIMAETGEEIEAVAGYQWHELERARWFQCMIDFPYKAGEPRMYTEHYARVHDQGGVFSFTHPDGRPMALSMRNRWSYGMQRETFVIKVHDGGETDSDLVYGWGQPGDDRIGINPGWIRVQCDLDTEKNRALQQGLRSDS